MVHLSLRAIAELVAMRSLDSLALGTGVWLFASALLRIAPRQNAASRFAVWIAALLAIATVPILSGIWSPGARLVHGSAGQSAFLIDDRWALYFFGGWAAVSVCFLVQVGRSLWRLHVLRRSCVAIDLETLDPVLRETLQKHGEHRRVTIWSSDQVKVPAAIGLWSPAVVVPEWAVEELSAEELNQIVLHELAHLRRWDDWTNLAQQVVKALFFFHPAVWWIERKAALEREMACDDAVLAVTAQPRAYAECLARLAERSFAHRSLALAQAALGKVRQMSTRVARILDANRPASSGARWRPAACLLAVFAIGCGGWYSRTPRLIAFGDRESYAPAPLVAAAPAVLQSSDAVEPILASLKQSSNRPAPLERSTLTPNRSKAATPETKSLVRYARVKSSAIPVTQTVWVVVERDEPAANRQVFQIEMWRITILQDEANSVHTPRKI